MKLLRHPLLIGVFVGVFLTATVTGFIVAKSFEHQAGVSRRGSIVKLIEAVRSWSGALDQSLAGQLAFLVAKEKSAPKPDAAFLSSEFQALASFTQTDNGWSLDWWRSRVSDLNLDEAQSALDTSRWAKLNVGDVDWQRVLLANQQVMFAMAIPVASQAGEINQIVVGFAGPGLFELAPFADPTGGSDLFIVDQSGTAVGYPEAQYVGSKIDSHPIVADLLKTPEQERIKNFRVGYRKFIGGFERVEGSNLYVVASRTLPDALTILSPVFLSFFVFALLAAATMTAIVMVGLGNERSQRELLEQNLRLVSAKPAVVVGALSNEQKTNSLEQDEFLRAVVDYLRVPTTAIAGFLQLLDAQLSSSTLNVKKHLQQLKDDAKVIYQFVDSLSRETRLPAIKLDIIDLPSLLFSAIATKKEEWRQRRIVVDDHFQPGLRVKADFDRLKAAITALLDFAVNYVSEVQPPILSEGLDKSRVSIHARKLGGMVEVRIEAHGRELSRDIRRKLFTPFEVRRGRNSGLDLALAKAWLAEMQGEILVESIEFEGFQVLCKIPAITSDSVAISEVRSEL